MTSVLLATAYFPPIQYLSKIAHSDSFCIERFENYNRQTYRNRCVIYSSNGALALCIPVKKTNQGKNLITDIRLDYDTDWQKNHWKAIESAYRSSAFYEYYIDELSCFFTKKYEFLIDFNSEILSVILKLMKIKKSIQFTNEYLTLAEQTFDFREIISPKKDFRAMDADFMPKKYFQVFDTKFGFIPNLSCIDLLFNTGNESLEYL